MLQAVPLDSIFLENDRQSSPLHKSHNDLAAAAKDPMLRPIRKAELPVEQEMIIQHSPDPIQRSSPNNNVRLTSNNKPNISTENTLERLLAKTENIESKLQSVDSKLDDMKKSTRLKNILVLVGGGIITFILVVYLFYDVIGEKYFHSSE